MTAQPIATPKPRTARPAIREAEVHSEPQREPVRAKVRTRRGGGTDYMHIPSEKVPDGIDLQWNTETVLGAPASQEKMQMEQQGWEPVTIGMFGGRFDYLMARGAKGQITYGAARLDWRPMELTLEARAEDRNQARQAVHVQEAKLRAGALDGVTLDTQHPTARANTRLTREIVPGMPVPK